MEIETNWCRLGFAVEYYRTLGYKYVELPWTVPKSIMKATIGDLNIIESGLGPLIGSSEQAFVERDYNGKLGDGKFMSCTPCFRDDEEDETHRPMFMKVELYQNIDVNPDGLEEMVEDASGFFFTETKNAVILETIEGCDIEVNGIEIGSYGIRRFKHVNWIYGTGLAEPRFSMAITETNRWKS